MIGSRTPIRSALIVGFVGMLFGGVLAARSLGSVDWDPTLFTSFGEEATATREYGEEKLGEVYLRAVQGHDGKFFFVQANVPWLVEPGENAEVVGLPRYRSQRMSYPMLAGASGILGPEQILLLAAAALTREVMLVAAVGAAWWLWNQGRRRIALAMALISALVVGVWALYLRVRLDGDQESLGVVGLPLVGLTKAVPQWMGAPVALLAGFGMIMMLVLYTRQVFRSHSLLGWTFLGFVPLAILFTEKVWVNWFDFTRVIAPIITAFVLLVFVGSGANRGGGVDSRTEEPSSEPLPL